MTRFRRPGTGRTQLRVGGRWANKKSGRVAVVSQILYPHNVWFKYERPLRHKDRQREYMTREPFTRRTKVPYRCFVLNFTRPAP